MYSWIQGESNRWSKIDRVSIKKGKIEKGTEPKKCMEGKRDVNPSVFWIFVKNSLSILCYLRSFVLYILLAIQYTYSTGNINIFTTYVQSLKTAFSFFC